jgi:hypothetical protein
MQFHQQMEISFLNFEMIKALLGRYAKLKIMIIRFCCDDSLNSVKWQMMSLKNKSSFVMIKRKLLQIPLFHPNR